MFVLCTLEKREEMNRSICDEHGEENFILLENTVEKCAQVLEMRAKQALMYGA